jgi:recombination protein RecA
VNIDQILSNLTPEVRKLLSIGTDFHIERQPTPSILLNRALGGGLAYGRQVLLYGSKSSGKSTFCLQMIADAQRAGKACAWIDSENSFDPDWARALGVDTDALLVSRAHKVNDAVDIGKVLIGSGIDILVIDSISALMPAIFFEKNGEMKDLSETKQMGADARDMAHAIKMLNYSNDKTLIILISQQRKALGSMFVRNIPTGGEAVKFFSSTIIRLFSSDSENQAIKDKVDIGGKSIEVTVGREINWLIEANKLGPSFETGKYSLIFKGDKIGIDSSEELMSMAELSGLVSKEGTWYTLLNKKFQGRKNMVKELRENEEFRRELIELL